MSIKLKGSSDGSVSFDAPADTSPSGSDITLTLPTSAGSADQFLKNSGIAGTLEFSSMVETSTGVGIGESSPNTKLVVKDASNATNDSVGNINVISSDSAAINKGGSIGLGGFYNGTSNSIPFANIHGKKENSTGNNAEGYFAVSTRSSSGTGERIRVDSEGRLLIGTTSTTNARDYADDLVIGSLSGDRGMTIVSATNKSGSINFSDGVNTGGASFKGIIQYNHNQNYMRFYTDETERMRIASNGEQRHYGQNATSLNIANSAGAGNQYEFLYCQHSSTGLANGTNSFRVATDGDVFNTNNSYGSLSDQRLKENIVDATSQWDDIKGLRVRKYNFRQATGHETHTQLGLIAQEVESVSPGLVETSAVKEGQTVLDADGNQLESIKSINYSVLYMKAVKALQEAQTRIETLEAQHADLLARVTALEAA